MGIAYFSLLLLLPLIAAALGGGNESSAANSTAAAAHDISWWCNKTPHPEPCQLYFKNHNNDSVSNSYHNITQRSEFRHLLIQAVLDAAAAAYTEVANQFELNGTDPSQHTVLTDCNDLYQDTILRLNRTLSGLETPSRAAIDPHALPSTTDFDAQTWLSTALTNLETCRRGFQDLNISDLITPVISNTNLSEHIRNALAVNAALIEPSDAGAGTGNYTFPIWLTGKDRRLLLAGRFKKADVVVAQDGSGHFRTVQAALNMAGRRKVTSARFVIYVKRGVYRENIFVRNDNNNVMLIGDGMRRTVITSSRSVKGGYTTYSSATAGIEGFHFIARDIAFRNTAGPQQGQAVALRSSSDLSVFYRCSFEGYQDTLMVNTNRQFYRECYIHGTIDFIFGNAAVVFQNCIIVARRPIKGQANVITAQGRTDPYQNTGIVIQNSRISPSPDLIPVLRSVKTYLGRPWQQYSRTVIMKSYIDSLISPDGWSPWIEGSSFALDTLYYGEYKNFGPGASTMGRVRWKGFRVINDPSSATRFTVGSLISGQSWLPATGIPFTSGL